jgi:hypothetical protein
MHVHVSSRGRIHNLVLLPQDVKFEALYIRTPFGEKPISLDEVFVAGQQTVESLPFAGNHACESLVAVDIEIGSQLNDYMSSAKQPFCCMSQ